MLIHGVDLTIEKCRNNAVIRPAAVATADHGTFFALLVSKRYYKGKKLVTNGRLGMRGASGTMFLRRDEAEALHRLGVISDAIMQKLAREVAKDQQRRKLENAMRDVRFIERETGVKFPKPFMKRITKAIASLAATTDW